VLPTTSDKAPEEPPVAEPVPMSKYPDVVPPLAVRTAPEPVPDVRRVKVPDDAMSSPPLLPADSDSELLPVNVTAADVNDP
jgi:hypothetical protein